MIARTLVPLLWLLLLSGCAATIAPERSRAAVSTCPLAPANRAWLADAIDAWKFVQDDLIGETDASAREAPVILAFDENCTFAFRMFQSEPFANRAHNNGAPAVPGPPIPVGPAAFQSENRVVIALPSVWQEAGVESAVGLDALVTGIFLHEMSHTLDSERRLATLRPLQDAGGLPSQLTGNLLQEVLGKNPEYTAVFEAERDTLFAAVDAATNAEARLLAAEALAMMRMRRATWFAGSRAPFQVHEDVFLTSEGLGQWVNYRYLRDAAVHVPANVVRREVRNGGWNWMQDAGLALILLAERLLPDWKERVLREPDWRAEALLVAIAEEAHGAP